MQASSAVRVGLAPIHRSSVAAQIQMLYSREVQQHPRTVAHSAHVDSLSEMGRGVATLGVPVVRIEKVRVSIPFSLLLRIRRFVLVRLGHRR